VGDTWRGGGFGVYQGGAQKREKGGKRKAPVGQQVSCDMTSRLLATVRNRLSIIRRTRPIRSEQSHGSRHTNTTEIRTREHHGNHPVSLRSENEAKRNPPFPDLTNTNRTEPSTDPGAPHRTDEHTKTPPQADEQVTHAKRSRPPMYMTSTPAPKTPVGGGGGEKNKMGRRRRREKGKTIKNDTHSPRATLIVFFFGQAVTRGGGNT